MTPREMIKVATEMVEAYTNMKNKTWGDSVYQVLAKYPEAKMEILWGMWMTLEALAYHPTTNEIREYFNEIIHNRYMDRYKTPFLRRKE